MMDHYYSEKPSSKSEESLITGDIAGHTFKFHTDKGVFSKNSVDFGTKLLMETIIEDLDIAPGSFLDMGCGYGPIGISAAHFFPDANVMLADINQRAVSLAQRNIVENGIKNAKTVQSDGFEKIKSLYEVVALNPPIRAGKKIVYPMFEKAKEHLEDNGSFYCVIQKKQGSESAVKKLLEIFGNCTTINRKSGYRIHKAVKKP